MNLFEKRGHVLLVLFGIGTLIASAQTASLIGREVAIPVHLRDGQEYDLSIPQLIQYGEKLFSAKWTSEEGEGRPHVKGTATGPPLSDSTDPLVFPHNFNRISGSDSDSCSGCPNEPYEGGVCGALAELKIDAAQRDQWNSCN